MFVELTSSWLYWAMVKHFKVSAELGLPAHVFLLERDSAAFRSLVATVGTTASRCSCWFPLCTLIKAGHPCRCLIWEALSLRMSGAKMV